MLIQNQVLAWNGAGSSNFTDIIGRGSHTHGKDSATEEPSVAGNTESLGRFLDELK